MAARRRRCSLKCEHLQPIGAFKIRGAYTAIARLGARGAGRAGSSPSSSGNHGQAVAWVAQRFGIRSVIVMPESAPAVKVAGVRRYGGEVVFAGRTRSPEQQAGADGIAAEEGLAMIPPFDHPDVIAGQGTCGLEILEQVPGRGHRAGAGGRGRAALRHHRRRSGAPARRWRYRGRARGRAQADRRARRRAAR